MLQPSGLARRVFVSTIIQPDKEHPPASYKHIADANDHLHEVINALLKERSGQSLTAKEQERINNCVAMKRWKLKQERSNV